MNKKVYVYSIHYNRPEFIRWQDMSLKAHLKDDYEFFVVNNAREQGLRDQITMVANDLKLPVIHTHSDTPFHLAGKHHADSLNEVWKKNMCAHKDGIVMFMDGDCFLVAPFSANEKMEGGTTFYGAKQQREHIYHYLTPVIVCANMELIPEPETIDWEGIGIGPQGTRLDTGGGLHLYLERHPEVKEKIKGMHNTWHIKPQNGNMSCLPDSLLKDYNPDYHIEFFGNEFLHYCRSSNWDHQPLEHHYKKSEFVARFLNGTFAKPGSSNYVPAKQHDFQMPNDDYFGWGKWVV